MNILFPILLGAAGTIAGWIVYRIVGRYSKQQFSFEQHFTIGASALFMLSLAFKLGETSLLLLTYGSFGTVLIGVALFDFRTHPDSSLGDGSGNDRRTDSGGIRPALWTGRFANWTGVRWRSSDRHDVDRGRAEERGGGWRLEIRGYDRILCGLAGYRHRDGVHGSFWDGRRPPVESPGHKLQASSSRPVAQPSSLSDFRGPELNQRCGKSVGMSERFRAFDRDTLYLLPPSVQDWLPESHLARFVVEVVSELDLGELERAYAGRGSKAYHREMLLAMLFYGYATGVFSSRKQEQATYDSVAFRYIAANTHPDHDTIATFRKRFLKQLKPLFVQILLLARTMGFLNLGKISLDGSKVKANASKHSALSWGHATELEEQLKAEVARLMEMAAAADADVPEEMDIPSELKRREDRLKAIGRCKGEAGSASRRTPFRRTGRVRGEDGETQSPGERDRKTARRSGPESSRAGRA